MYVALIVLTGAIMLYALLTRSNSHLSVLHLRAPLFTQTAEGGIRNGYTLRFSNKLAEPQDFTLEVSGLAGVTLSSVVARALPGGRLGVRLDPDSTLEVPVYVTTAPEINLGASSTPIAFTAVDSKTGERNVVADHFFGP
jgi:polyferredoxin